MKTENKEEAKSLSIKNKIREILVNHSDNKNANDKIEVELLDLFHQTRFHPETFERVEKPDFYYMYEDHIDDSIEWGFSKEDIALGLLKQCKAYNNALTLDQLLERCKEMREGLIDLKDSINSGINKNDLKTLINQMIKK